LEGKKKPSREHRIEERGYVETNDTTTRHQVGHETHARLGGVWEKFWPGGEGIQSGRIAVRIPTPRRFAHINIKAIATERGKKQRGNEGTS